MNIPGLSGIPSKMMESVLGKMPDFNKIMPGFEFKDGKLNRIIEFKTPSGQVQTEGDFVVLHAGEDIHVFDDFTFLKTDLTLVIKPTDTIFMAFLMHDELIGQPEVIVPGGEPAEVGFMVKSAKPAMRQFIRKGEVIGMGLFMPYLPLNNIELRPYSDDTP